MTEYVLSQLPFPKNIEIQNPPNNITYKPPERGHVGGSKPKIEREMKRDKSEVSEKNFEAELQIYGEKEITKINCEKNSNLKLIQATSKSLRMKNQREEDEKREKNFRLTASHAACGCKGGGAGFGRGIMRGRLLKFQIRQSQTRNCKQLKRGTTRTACRHPHRGV